MIDSDLTPVVNDIIESIFEHGGIATISNESHWVQFFCHNIDDHDVGGGKFIKAGIGDLILTNQLLSVGSVTITYNNPNSRPIIDHNYLGDESGNDIESVLNSIKFQTEYIGSSTSFHDNFNNCIINLVILILVLADDNIEEWICNNGGRSCHPTNEDDYCNGIDTSIVVIAINHLITVSANTNFNKCDNW